ncbi:MAG TPA: hypothetical protein VID72_09040 [Ktedonobacterales bacterium]
MRQGLAELVGQTALRHIHDAATAPGGRQEVATMNNTMNNTINSTMDNVTCAHLDIRALVRALADGWQAYLPAINALSAADTDAYLTAQRYDHVRDLLAQATAWGEETLGVVPILLRGGAIQRYDATAFDAQAIVRYSMFASADVERRFTQAYATLARMLAFLSDDALTRPDVYDWLHTTIVERFNAHRPPNLPGIL